MADTIITNTPNAQDSGDSVLWGGYVGNYHSGYRDWRCRSLPKWRISVDDAESRHDKY